MHYDDEKAPNTIEEGVNRIIECILVEFIDSEEYLEYPNCCYVNWNDAQKKRYIKSSNKVVKMLSQFLESGNLVKERVKEASQVPTNLNKSMTIRDYMRAYVG